MSAVNIVDEVCEVVPRDCFLIVFKHAPWRFAAEDADVVGGLKSREKDQEQK